MKSEPDICLLLAAERSGTHLLRSLLANVNGVAAPAEICNATVPNNRSAKSSFFAYRKQALLSDPELFFPTEPVQRQFLDGFLAHIRGENPKRSLVVLDIKYAHVHNFNFFWWDPLETPYLLQYAKWKRLKVLHLVRSKVYRTAISGFYAHQTGVWRAKTEQETRQIRITIDPQRLEKKAQSLARTIERFEAWLSHCPHHHISYESLSDNRAETLQRLGEYLGLAEPIADDPGFVRTTPVLEESIENFSAIESLVDLDWTVVSKPVRRAKLSAQRLAG